jgi:hypothetical protein
VLACVCCSTRTDLKNLKRFRRAAMPNACGSSLLHPKRRSERQLLCRRVMRSAHIRYARDCASSPRVERGRSPPGERSLTGNMKWQVTAISNRLPEPKLAVNG